jgi:hypothetical protein
MSKPQPWSPFMDSTITDNDDVPDILNQLANGNTFVAYCHTECGTEVFNFTCRNKKIDKSTALYWISNTERRRLIRYFKENPSKVYQTI